MRLLIILAFLILQTTTQAQKKLKTPINYDTSFNIIDSSKYKCIYNYSYISDSLDTNSKEEAQMVLLIGYSDNIFMKRSNYRMDSLFYLRDVGIIDSKRVSAGYNEVSFKGPGYHIRNTYGKKETNIRYRTTKGEWECNEEVNFKWILGNETEMIAGYNCKNAFTTFRGRKYTAWYTPEIPLQYGPYKFKDLPGLIIKVEDKRKTHVFELASLQKLKVLIIQKDKKTIKMSSKQLKKALRDYEIDMLEKIKAWLQNDPDRALKASQKIINTNNPIELIVE